MQGSIGVGNPGWKFWKPWEGGGEVSNPAEASARLGLALWTSADFPFTTLSPLSLTPIWLISMTFQGFPPHPHHHHLFQLFLRLKNPQWVISKSCNWKSTSTRIHRKSAFQTFQKNGFRVRINWLSGLGENPIWEFPMISAFFPLCQIQGMIWEFPPVVKKPKSRKTIHSFPSPSFPLLLPHFLSFFLPSPLHSPRIVPLCYIDYNHFGLFLFLLPFSFFLTKKRKSDQPFFLWLFLWF